jgi:hypothetical protein
MKVSSFLVSSALLAAVVAMPASAQALDVQDALKVEIYSATAPGLVDVGEWHCFQESTQLVEEDFQEFCRYVCKWVNNAYEPLSSNLYIDERIVAGFADCYDNSRQAVLTDIRLAPGFLSKGFTRNQEKKEIKALILGEVGDCASADLANGSVAFHNGGYPQYHGITVSRKK